MAILNPSTPAVAGQIRFNEITKQIEIYTATTWQTLAGAVPEPQTWREWLDYFANEIIDHGGVDHKLLYIRNKMWERFPGPYTIKHAGNRRYDLDFDNPAEETWWHLKYD